MALGRLLLSRGADAALPVGAGNVAVALGRPLQWHGADDAHPVGVGGAVVAPGRPAGPTVAMGLAGRRPP